VLRLCKHTEYDLDEADEQFLAQSKEYTHPEGPPFRFTADTLEKIIDYFEKESFQQVCLSCYYILCCFILILFLLCSDLFF
jgi:hypothetical protein